MITDKDLYERKKYVMEHLDQVTAEKKFCSALKKGLGITTKTMHEVEKSLWGQELYTPEFDRANHIFTRMWEQTAKLPNNTDYRGFYFDLIDLDELHMRMQEAPRGGTQPIYCFVQDGKVSVIYLHYPRDLWAPFELEIHYTFALLPMYSDNKYIVTRHSITNFAKLITTVKNNECDTISKA